MNRRGSELTLDHFYSQQIATGKIFLTEVLDAMTAIKLQMPIKASLLARCFTWNSRIMSAFELSSLRIIRNRL